jgi:hypothetical protein
MVWPLSLPLRAATPGEPLEKQESKIPTVEELSSGYRKGLFYAVAEQGPLLLAKEPKAPIKGMVAVSLALFDRMGDVPAELRGSRRRTGRSD